MSEATSCSCARQEDVISSGDTVTRQKPADAHGVSAEIVPFPMASVIAFGRPSAAGPRAQAAGVPAIVHLLSMRDRITALDWAERARAFGVSRVVFEMADNVGDHETGEFILIYERCRSWASWGIGCGEGGLTLWRTACGTTIGQFLNLRSAFDRIEQLTQAG